MRKLFNRFLYYKNIFYPIFLILISGILGGFLTATVVLLFVFLALKTRLKTEFIFILLLLVFFLGDNYNGLFNFAVNFRFVVLGVALLYLLKEKLLVNNYGNYILPFTIYATVITFMLSPVGITAKLRAVSFWVVAIVLFKLITLLYRKNSQRFFNLLVVLLMVYFGLTISSYFVPGFSSFLNGRFKGIMGNPNGLGLLSLFCYALLGLIKDKKEAVYSDQFFRRFKYLLIFLIILTGSRTALFSVLVYEVIVRLLHKKALMVFYLLLIGFIFTFINSVGFETLVESAGLTEFLRIDSIKDASGRTEVWPVAWAEINKNPWFGQGIMYDNYFIDDYVERYFGENVARQWGGVWSSYLSLLLDVGIIGSIVYTLFYIKVFKKSSDKKLALGFLSICLLSGLTESWMASSMNAFTPIMFLYWAIQTQNTQKTA